jgi:spore maturation protein CgeB
MKILLIIKTDNSFSNGIRILESLERLGHEVFASSFGKSVRDYCARYKKFNPDFIFQTGIGFPRCNLDVQRELKNLDAKLVMWYPDAYWLFQEPSRSYFLDAFNVFDLIFTTMRGHVEVAKPYTNKVVWEPHYFDPTFFKSDNILTQENDVIFIGGKTEASPQREEYLNEIVKVGYKLKVIGYGFNINGEKTDSNWNGEYIAAAYKSSKIGLNIISGNVLNCDLQFSARIYQVMGCGCFLLTEYVPNIEELFVPGVHLDVFYTKEEMLEKIKYYIENPEIRERIAKQGQEEVLKNHTIDIRVNQYLKVIKEKLFV